MSGAVEFDFGGGLPDRAAWERLRGALAADRPARVRVLAYPRGAPPTAAEEREAAGQACYAAYRRSVDSTWDERPLPTWGELGERQREGWRAAAAYDRR